MESANMPYSIAVASADDIDALVALVNSAYRGESSRRGWTTEEHLLGGQRIDADRIAELIDTPDHNILVAQGDTGLCGCVLLEQRPDRVCYLGLLTVRPDLQSRGIGARLLHESESWARNNYRSLFVEMTVIDLRPELIA